MNPRCQVQEPLAIAVSGTAGSGKSTLGRAIAAALRAPIVDLDTATNPLLDRIQDGVLDDRGHWLASRHSQRIREGRYAALRALARESIAVAGAVVLVAPFTAELRGGADWEDLVAAVRPAGLKMVHIVGDESLFERRRRARAERRDLFRAPSSPLASPAVPVLDVDAYLSVEQQLFRVLRGLGFRTELDASGLPGLDFEAVLFDLDGTLVDSTASVIRSWSRLGEEFGTPDGLARAVHFNHGRPARTLLAQALGPADQADALERITELEIDGAAAVTAVPGATELFASLPENYRAIVTSGSRRLATARLEAAGLPVPRVMVTADDVATGKPDPEPYLLAASRLGVDPSRCLALEDAAAGIDSARAAGCTVVAVEGTSSRAELGAAAFSVDGLDRLRLTPSGRSWRLSISNAGQPAGSVAPGAGKSFTEPSLEGVRLERQDR